MNILYLLNTGRLKAYVAGACLGLGLMLLFLPDASAERPERHKFEAQSSNPQGRPGILPGNSSDNYTEFECKEVSQNTVRVTGEETGLTGSTEITCIAPPACETVAECAHIAVPNCQKIDCKQGKCALENLGNGAACSDGDSCSSPDTCLNGVCKAGPAIVNAQCCPPGTPFCAVKNECLPLGECHTCPSPQSCMVMANCPPEKVNCPAAQSDACPGDTGLECCTCEDANYRVTIHAMGSTSIGPGPTGGVRPGMVMGKTVNWRNNQPFDEEYKFEVSAGLKIIGPDTGKTAIVACDNPRVPAIAHIHHATKTGLPSSNAIRFDCTTTMCFLPGTPVEMADGSEQVIENLKIGDALRGINPDTGEAHVNNIVAVLPPRKDAGYFELKIGDKKLGVTGEHPFYVGNGQYTKVVDLKEGQELFHLVDGRLVPMKLESKTWIEKEVTVYNVETDGFNNYIADGIVVHNKSFAECWKYGAQCVPKNTCDDPLSPAPHPQYDPYGNMRCGQGQECCPSCTRDYQCFDGDDCTGDLCNPTTRICSNPVVQQCACSDGSAPDPVNGCPIQRPRTSCTQPGTSCQTKEVCDANMQNPNFIPQPTHNPDGTVDSNLKMCYQQGVGDFGVGYCCGWGGASPRSCGDSVLQLGEQCEKDLADPACPKGTTCMGCLCKPDLCGNGDVDSGEQCGEPNLPKCPAGKTCNKCKCEVGVNPPPPECSQEIRDAEMAIVAERADDSFIWQPDSVLPQECQDAGFGDAASFVDIGKCCLYYCGGGPLACTECENGGPLETAAWTWNDGGGGKCECTYDPPPGTAQDPGIWCEETAPGECSNGGECMQGASCDVASGGQCMGIVGYGDYGPEGTASAQVRMTWDEFANIYSNPLFPPGCTKACKHGCLDDPVCCQGVCECMGLVGVAFDDCLCQLTGICIPSGCGDGKLDVVNVGNEFAGGGEECDLGLANGQGDSPCNAECKCAVPAGQVGPVGPFNIGNGMNFDCNQVGGGNNGPVGGPGDPFGLQCIPHFNGCCQQCGGNPQNPPVPICLDNNGNACAPGAPNCQCADPQQQAQFPCCVV